MITELTSDSQSVSDAGASEHPVISLGSDQTILVKSSDAAAGAGHHNKGAVSLTPLSLSSLDVSGQSHKNWFPLCSAPGSGVLL